MLKKFLVILLALLMVFSIVGCSKPEESVETTTTEDTEMAQTVDSEQKTPQAEAEDAVEEKPSGTITVWGWEQIKVNVDLLIEDFNKEYPDIEVNFEIPGTNNDLYQKYLLALSAGEGIPDVVTLESSNLPQFIEAGGLLDITDKVTPYVDKIVESKWASVTKDGKMYGMPWDIGPVGLYYRRDVFEAAGYDSSPEAVAALLATWDDYYEVAKVIKENTGKYMLAESVEKPTARTMEILLWQRGQLYFDADGTPLLNTPIAVESLEFLGKLKDADVIDNSEEWTQPWYDSIANGNIATIINASWMGGFISGWIAPDTSGQWGVVPLPAYEVGGAVTANSGGSNFAISKESQNPEAAWAFVEFYLGRVDSNLAIYEATDIFPALKETYASDFFKEPVPFYADQSVRSVFAELAQQVPAVRYTANYQVAKDAMNDAIQRYFLNGETSSEALNYAQSCVEDAIQ